MKLSCVLLLFFLSAITASYRDEVITGAEYMTRPSVNKILNYCDIQHHGIRVYTDAGSTYLIHNMPSAGVVVTDAQLSGTWEIRYEIEVNGYKTVGGALEAGSGIGRGFVNYVTSGTCIGAASEIEDYLSSY